MRYVPTRNTISQWQMEKGSIKQRGKGGVQIAVTATLCKAYVIPNIIYLPLLSDPKMHEASLLPENCNNYINKTSNAKINLKKDSYTKET